MTDAMKSLNALRTSDADVLREMLWSRSRSDQLIRRID